MHKTRLKDVLKKQGRKQQWLAEQVGLNKDTMSRIVNGKNVPSLYTAMKIADALGLDVKDLWPLEDDES